MDHVLSDYQKIKRTLEKIYFPDISNEILSYVYHEYEITQFKRSEVERKFNNNECSICKKKYDEKVFILSCYHKFHGKCIYRYGWCKYIPESLVLQTTENKDVDSGYKCPLCKSPIKCGEENAIASLFPLLLAHNWFAQRKPIRGHINTSRATHFMFNFESTL